jgi:hypothetical protein
MYDREGHRKKSPPAAEVHEHREERIPGKATLVDLPFLPHGHDAAHHPSASELAFDPVIRWFDQLSDPVAHEATHLSHEVGAAAHRVEEVAVATRTIAGEDFRMMLDKLTGHAPHRGPHDLANEQRDANRAEHQLHPGERSAYEHPGRPPVLVRPVLMIPGLTMDASSFDPLAEQLDSTGKNGHVAVYVAAQGRFHMGGVHGPAATREQLAHVRMFQLQYRDPKAAPTDKQGQIAAAMSAIEHATGAGTIDVVTHSAGGTDFRLYLQERDPRRGPHIGNTIMIGPASHGTFMGNVGGWIGRPLGVNKAGAELAMHSPLISMLNATWGHQRGQIHGRVTIIAVGGAPTVGRHGITDGDGYMPANEAAMPHADTIYLRGRDPTAVAHLREVEYSGVIAIVQEALARGEATLHRR